MAVPDEGHHGGGQSLTAAVSNAVVGIVRDYTGRGPTKARTTIRDNVVLVMLEDSVKPSTSATKCAPARSTK